LLLLKVLRVFEEKFNCPILSVYGLSEAAPIVSFHCPDRERKPGSVGEIVELLARGPNLSSGYYKISEERAMTLTDGWLHTGDMARRDEDGYPYIVERKKARRYQTPLPKRSGDVYNSSIRFAQ